MHNDLVWTFNRIRNQPFSNAIVAMSLHHCSCYSQDAVVYSVRSVSVRVHEGCLLWPQRLTDTPCPFPNPATLCVLFSTHYTIQRLRKTIDIDRTRKVSTVSHHPLTHPSDYSCSSPPAPGFPHRQLHIATVSHPFPHLFAK